MCTDVVIEENTYYMVLKKLDGYDWSMLMLVPTSDHYAQMCLRVADNGIGMSKEFRNSRNFKLKKSGRVFIMDGKNKTERQCCYA